MRRIKIVILTSCGTLAHFSEICDWPVAAVSLMQVTLLLQFPAASFLQPSSFRGPISFGGFLISLEYSPWMRIPCMAFSFGWESRRFGLLLKKSASFPDYGHICLH